MPQHSPTSRLILTLLGVGGIWGLSNTGYFFALPLAGVNVSYLHSPFVLALYFLVWQLLATYLFWTPLKSRIRVDSRVWVYVLYIFACGALTWHLLYVLSLREVPNGPELVPYSDVLFATPLYFIPKSVEILLQQTLIAALIVALYERYTSLRATAVAYAILFGGTHAMIYLMSSAPTPYALTATIAATLSALVFPYLILRVRSGFLYTFIIHLLFYLIAAIALHTWPPPGYF